VREIESKLEFDPANLARIRADPLLAATDSQRKTLHSIYYDTADLALRKAGVSLRLRDTDGRFVQTIKSSNGNAGLFDRSEWEHEVKDRDIDLIAATGTALGPLLSVRVRNALRPVFETRVNRTSRRVFGVTYAAEANKSRSAHGAAQPQALHRFQSRRD
jgi:triphosphatase